MRLLRQPSPFQHVTLRWITVGAACTAALLAGDVDLIELVPPARRALVDRITDGLGFISRPDENSWAYNARLEPPPGPAPR